MIQSDSATQQQQFFRRLSSGLPPSLALIAVVQDVLGLGRDAAYRRIRGETPLKVDEYIKLCRYARLPLHLWQDAEADDPAAARPPESAELQTYLEGMLRQVRLVQENATEAWFTVKDIPSFHLFALPELAALNLYIWGRFVLRQPQLLAQRFDLTEFQRSYRTEIGICGEIADTYAAIPVTEIWGTHTGSSLSRRVDFLASRYLTSREDLARLRLAAGSMIGHLQKKAAQSRAFLRDGQPSGRYTLYFQEIHDLNNEILVLSPQSKTAYISFGLISYQPLESPALVAQLQDWIDNLISLSACISGENEAQRLSVFGRLAD